MTLKEFSEKFFPLPPQAQIKFIYTNIDSLSERERILFFVSLIKDEASSLLVKATALKFLRQSSYLDLETYRKYLDNRFQALSKAARKALKDLEEKDSRNQYIAASVLKKVESTPDNQKRLKILKAIAGLQASWVPRVLMEALADPNESIRDFVVWDLGQREIINLTPLYQKLSKPPWFAKSACLRILALKKNPEAIRQIENVIKDANADVRKCAAEALGEIGGKEALSLLVKLSSDRNPYVKRAAEEAVHRISHLRFT